MIEKYFQDLYEIDGVDAIALLDNMNRIVDGWGNSKYDSSIFGEIGESYLQLYGINEKFGFDVDETVVLFDRGSIFVRNYSMFMILVIASPNIDISYLRLAVNVCVSELVNSKKIQKILKRLPAERPSLVQDSKLDENERSMIDRIMENRDATRRTD